MSPSEMGINVPSTFVTFLFEEANATNDYHNK